MEKKTNKAKLAILKFLRKSVLSQIGGNYVLSANSNMLVRVFLHAEFISAMKTVPNPTFVVKNAKKKKKKKKKYKND